MPYKEYELLEENKGLLRDALWLTVEIVTVPIIDVAGTALVDCDTMETLY